MALTRNQWQGVRDPVETLEPPPHPKPRGDRTPNVVALAGRLWGNIDDQTHRASGAPAPGPSRPGGPREAGAPMNGAAARAANVLPLAARRERAGHWRRSQDGAREDEVPAADLARMAGMAEAAEMAEEAEMAALDEAADLVDGLDADAALAAAIEDAPRSAPGRPGPGGAGNADDATLCSWITRIAHQDERALEALYDATAARVNGLVLRILQRAALAEEVLEDTFWQVWRQAPRFDATRGRPVTWLLAMARSRAIDALRREQRFQHDALPEDDDADAAGLSGSGALPPQDLLEATRSQAHVHAALASLEPRSRQLVALAFFRGLAHEEIAEQQGLPLGTVKSLIRRALQQLRRVMEAEHA